MLLAFLSFIVGLALLVLVSSVFFSRKNDKNLNIYSLLILASAGIQRFLQGVEEFKLIDGTFIAIDATDVLLNLVNHKIQYHDLQVFKMMERYEKEGVERHIDRMTELKEMREEMKHYLQTMGGLNCRFRIKTTISIEPLVAETSNQFNRLNS